MMLPEIIYNITCQGQIGPICQNQGIVSTPSGIIFQLKNPKPNSGQSRQSNGHNIISKELRNISFHFHKIKLRKQSNGLQNNREPNHHLRELEILIFLEVGDNGQYDTDHDDYPPIPEIVLFHERDFPIFDEQEHQVTGQGYG